MKPRPNVRRAMGAVVVLAVGLTAALVPAGVASADEAPIVDVGAASADDAPVIGTEMTGPNPGPGYTLTVEDSKDYTVIECSGSATAPHLNLSIPNSVQWEGHITCSRTRSIWLQIYLMKIVGTGENEHSVLADWTPGTTVVAKFRDINDRTPCEGSVSTRYFTRHYGRIDGIQMTPYPADSPSVTLPCFLST